MHHATTCRTFVVKIAGINEQHGVYWVEVDYAKLTTSAPKK